MKHLSFNEFKELMKKRGKTIIITNDGNYLFTGIDEYKVCVEFRFKLKKNFQTEAGGLYIKFDKVLSLAEAQCMYESLKQ